MFVCYVPNRSRLEWTTFTARGGWVGGVTQGQVQKLNDESATCGCSMVGSWTHCTLGMSLQMRKAVVSSLFCALYWSHDLQDRDKLNNLVCQHKYQYIKPIHIFRKKSIGFFFLSQGQILLSLSGKIIIINQIKLNILHHILNHYHVFMAVSLGHHHTLHYMHACKCVTLSLPVSSFCPYTN